MTRELCPLTDPRVLIGPREERAGRGYYLVKHTGTDRIFRIGDKEQFLLSHMNGQNSLTDIAALFRKRFGTEMTDRAWESLFRSLDARSLLVSENAPDAGAPAGPKRLFVTTKYGFLDFAIRLANPERMLRAVEPKLRFLFSPVFIAFALIAIVAMETWVVLHAGAMYRQINQYGWGHFIHVATYVYPIVVLSMILHEFAHALACRHFGGNVWDLGLLFRYLTFYPYTRLDDVMFFHNRWHRVWVFSAGMFSTLLFSIPFAFLWSMAQAEDMKAIFGILVFALSFSTFMNLVPFVQLDGYFILSTAVRMPDLRIDAYLFWKGLIRRIFRPDAGRPAYSRREAPICGVYGLVSIVVTLYVTVRAALYWRGMLLHWAGDVYSWVLAVAIMGVFAIPRLRRSKLANRPQIGVRVS